MEPYTGFAQVYDMFMEEIPYETWFEFIDLLLKSYDIKDGTIVELGCGTGKMTRLLAGKGYTMIGVDISSDMLAIAQDQTIKEADNITGNILYIHQDMRELQLPGTASAIISVCDSLNYLIEYEELLSVFKTVNHYLSPGGLFIFDMTTEAKYQSIDDAVITENRDDASFIWENTYFSKERINQYELTFFVKQTNGLYKKSEEVHVQKAYLIEEIKNALKTAGLLLIHTWEDYTYDQVSVNSQRICFVAKEIEKQKEIMNKQ